MTTVVSVVDDGGNTYVSVPGLKARSHPVPFAPLYGVTAETWWCGAAVAAPSYVEATFDGDTYNRAMTVWRVASQTSGPPFPDVGHSGDPFDPQVWTDYSDANGFCGPTLPTDLDDPLTYPGTGHVFTFANAYGCVAGGFATSQGDTVIDGVTNQFDTGPGDKSGWVEFDVASQLSGSSTRPGEAASTKTMDWRVAHDKKLDGNGLTPWTAAGSHYSFPGYWVYEGAYFFPLTPNTGIYKALWAYGLESLGTAEIETATTSSRNLAYAATVTLGDTIVVNDSDFPVETPLAMTTVGQGSLATVIYMDMGNPFIPQIYRRTMR